MYEHLKGKTLLVMDRTALAACAVTRAKEMGIRTIVANFYKYEDSPSKQVADIAIDADISDTEKMLKIIKENHIDGIFVGWTDSHLPFYNQICEKAGLPCCGTKEQFDILSNDKNKFKAACRRYGVPTIPDYKIDIDFCEEDLRNIHYPVIVKPSDGSGSRGVKCCYNEKELIDHYSYLYNTCKNKNIICEQYIDSDKEIFLNYTIQNSECSLSAAYMSYSSVMENGEKGPAILHVYPSPYIQDYKKKIEPKVEKMFKGLGLKYAFVSLQGFVTDDGFVFHESGLRMGGGQSYVFTKALNGISSLDLMIEFAVTGEMKSARAKEKDNPIFKKYGVNYYISARSGRIKEIQGLQSVIDMPQVLQITTFHSAGDVIVSSRSLDSVVFRLHVMDDTKEKLADTICQISKNIAILDEEGNNMQTEILSYDRVMSILNKN